MEAYFEMIFEIIQQITMNYKEKEISLFKMSSLLGKKFMVSLKACLIPCLDIARDSFIVRFTLFV